MIRCFHTLLHVDDAMQLCYLTSSLADHMTSIWWALAIYESFIHPSCSHVDPCHRDSHRSREVRAMTICHRWHCITADICAQPCPSPLPTIKSTKFYFLPLLLLSLCHHLPLSQVLASTFTQTSSNSIPRCLYAQASLSPFWHGGFQDESCNSSYYLG